MDRAPAILRIDMGAARGPAASLEPLGRYADLAGVGMASMIVAEEVGSGCDPLGRENKLVVAADLPAGLAPGSGRMSIGCKSPLTGGIAVSHAVGPAAVALWRLGYAALIVEGQPDDGGLWKIVIDEGGVSFSIDNRYRKLGTFHTVARLERAHAGGAAYLTIGRAGEMRLFAASVVCHAGGRRPARHCGRRGAGAVMGSKRLKAIVVVDARAATSRGAGEAPQPPAGHDPGSPYRDACGIDDPALLARLARMQDDIGVDALEVAAAIGAAMKAGLARFGDGRAALRLLAEVGRGTPLGRILGSGARVTGDALGLEWDPVAGSDALVEGVEGRTEVVFGIRDEDLARPIRALVGIGQDRQLELPLGPPEPDPRGGARPPRAAHVDRSSLEN